MLTLLEMPHGVNCVGFAPFTELFVRSLERIIRTVKSMRDLVFHFYFGACNTFQDGEDICYQLIGQCSMECICYKLLMGKNNILLVCIVWRLEC